MTMTTRAARAARWLFASTIFLGSALVFLVQPMVAKQLLPTFGGTPNVWNTAVVSFQVLLLVGYAFAHVTMHLLGPRRQPIAQLALGAVALAFVPFSLSRGVELADGLPPAAAVAVLLVVGVGVPYLAVASASPVLQRWYASLGAADSDNPYFLYTASNAGSLVGLLAFPFLLEPTRTSTGQTRVWAVAFAIWVVGVLACALLTRRRSAPTTAGSTASSIDGVTMTGLSDEDHRPARVRVWRAARWIAVAAIPSAAMLGVTTFLTTDVASAPLLWVVPLALYLISFMVTFGRYLRIGPRLASAFSALTITILLVSELALIDVDALARSCIHLAATFAIAVLAHAWLYADRPPARQLTTFYLMLSIGGAIGGASLALVAPIAFDRVVEYPLLLVLALLVRPALWHGPARWRDSAGWRAALAIVELAVAGIVIGWLAATATEDDIWTSSTWSLVVVLALFAVLSVRRWGLLIVVGSLLALMTFATDAQVLHAERNFFGALRVEAAPDEVRLLHGTTLHGSQRRDDDRAEPTTYYGRSGPIGDVFTQLQLDAPFVEVGVVGLGTGSVLTYGRPFQRFTYYEIDPAVIDVARDPSLFTFVSGADVSVDIVEGDARLELAKARDGQFDLLVLDAYSSDAVPVHLLTTEAMELYVEKLAPGGVIALHISSRHLDLEPVVSANAEELGLIGRGRSHEPDLSGELSVDDTYVTSSHWLALSRTREDLAPLQAGEHGATWLPLVEASTSDAWSDDFSNIARTITWLPDWLR